MSNDRAAAPPRNGLLSGMALTWVAALGAVVVGLFVTRLHPVFGAAASPRLLDAFFVSVCLMAAHKLESYLTREFDVCPVYLTSGRAPWAANGRQALFVGFVVTFVAMTFVVYLVLRGPPWPLLFVAVWLAQGLHELHHLAKTAASGRYYSGTATAVLFVAGIDVLVFPAWHALLSPAPRALLVAYYAVQPVVLLAFFLEHRRWLASARILDSGAALP